MYGVIIGAFGPKARRRVEVKVRDFSVGTSQAPGRYVILHHEDDKARAEKIAQSLNEAPQIWRDVFGSQPNFQEDISPSAAHTLIARARDRIQTLDLEP